MLTIGLDVHQTRTSVCVLDDKGNTLQQREVKGGQEAVAEALGKLKESHGDLQVCYEASCGYGALYEKLTGVAGRVLVAHPGRLKLIFQSKKKHDRADAAKLATLLHLNQVPAVHVPSQEVRSWRGIIEHRRKLVDRAVAVKNQVRALLRGQGIRGLSGKRQWSQAGIKWLQAIRWPTALEVLRLAVLLEELEALQGKLKRVTEALDQVAQEHAGVALLRTIPGVGPRTAEAFVAYVDDPRRFKSGSIGSYLGLVPTEDSTGGRRRLGHITREGPGTLRKLLGEAVWRGLGANPRLRAFFERVRKGDPERRKLAVVATAHWLSRVMLAMLKSGEVYREQEGPEPTTAGACGPEGAGGPRDGETDA